MHTLNRIFASATCIAPILVLSISEIYRAKLIALFGGDVGAIYSYHALRLLFLVAFVFAFGSVFRQTSLSEARDAHREISLLHNPLLGLRFIAFVMVFLGHWFLVVFPATDAPNAVVAPASLWPLGASPWCGVWMFFTLSGYLMATGFIRGRYGLNPKGIIEFYRRRAYRIVPVYLSIGLLVALFTKPEMFRLWSGADATRLVDFLSFDSLGAMPIGALWSVATEVQFYLIVPFIIVIAEALKPKPIVFCLALGSAIAAIITHKLAASLGHNLGNWHAMVYQPMIVNLDVFLVGIVTAYIVEAMRIRQLSLRGGLQAGLGVLLILYLVTAYVSAALIIGGAPRMREVFVSIAPVLTALVTGLIIVLFECRRVSNRTETSSAGSRLWWLSAQGGTLTYILYVWSEPVMLALRRIAPASLDITTSITYLLAMGVPILTVLAVFFYRAVELPFNKR